LKKVYILAVKEIKMFFCSPMAWIILALFMLVTSIFFSIHVNEFSAFCSRLGFNPDFRRTVSINDSVIRTLEYDTAILLLLIVPLITMGSYAREAEEKTLGLLFSGTLETPHIVLGKYISRAFISCVFVFLSGLYPLICFFISEPDIMPVITGYAGLFLMAQALAAMGTAASIIAPRRLLAALLAMAINITLWTAGYFPAALKSSGTSGSYIETIFSYAGSMALSTNVFWLFRGLARVSEIFYFIVLTLISLLMTDLFLKNYKRGGY
jgi:ABC-2 type transport system permease protein